ncbi:LANO_0H20362g1_1 [Lachancea nothofagi CBS 11611]|uniref:LANO_0H20362g1_1 n=1 Tax=Lachancea nothofagi CBS 11611 TaxID=1266666 RepID=A0A1G4KNB1_9SACH|nr:LANO_0H20362g1_1 [Lachancea nothofagi CBS 11611]
MPSRACYGNAISTVRFSQQSSRGTDTTPHPRTCQDIHSARTTPPVETFFMAQTQQHHPVDTSVRPLLPQTPTPTPRLAVVCRRASFFSSSSFFCLHCLHCFFSTSPSGRHVPLFVLLSFFSASLSIAAVLVNVRAQPPPRPIVPPHALFPYLHCIAGTHLVPVTEASGAGFRQNTL